MASQRTLYCIQESWIPHVYCTLYTVQSVLRIVLFSAAATHLKEYAYSILVTFTTLAFDLLVARNAHASCQ